MKFTEGMKVCIVHYRTESFTVHTVTKVYKTGHFLIDDSKQQYRQDGSSTTGGWRGAHVEILTDERHAELIARRDAAERRMAFGHIVDQMHRRSWRTDVSEDQLERLRVLWEELKPKPSTE